MEKYSDLFIQLIFLGGLFCSVISIIMIVAINSRKNESVVEIAVEAIFCTFAGVTMFVTAVVVKLFGAEILFSAEIGLIVGAIAAYGSWRLICRIMQGVDANENDSVLAESQ